MIGNTDWAVPNLHNIKLIRARKDSLARPFAIPYDFDFAGFVDAPYASPSPLLGIESVRERSYRGFPRNMAEIEPILAVFNEKKDSIYTLIKNFDRIKPSTRQVMIKYIDEFYQIINNKTLVNDYFIANARRE
jgi:hypothetical protein